MMEILFIGDIENNNGPANVNKQLLKHFSPNVKVNHNCKRMMNIISNVYYLFLSKNLIVSGHSKLNYFFLLVSKLLGKKTYILIHGYLNYESEINNYYVDYKEYNRELKWFKISDKVICVSKTFCTFMKKQLPQFSEKFTYIYNGLDWEFSETFGEFKKINTQIMTVGGGRKQKNILSVCYAIEKLNLLYNTDFNLIVVGEYGPDTLEICNFDFVKYYGKVDKKTVEELMSMSKIFIQNSLYEPFGLAPLEALVFGCDLILSKNVGASEIIPSLSKNEIIDDTYDIDEIVSKLKYIIKRPNNARLLRSINKDITSVSYRAKEIEELILRKKIDEKV